MLVALEPQVSEVTLIRAAQNGDREAFGRLYQQYEPLIHGILISHVAYDQAEDLMQDVFVRAMEQLPTLREPRAFCGWLITIARRMAADHRRSAKASKPLDAIPLRAATCNAEPMAILAVMQRLPETYRETLVLRLIEGMTGPEIAARTGMTADSVRVNLCRGMKILRGYLKGRGREEA